MIKFNQKAWLKPYTVMSSELRQKAKNGFEKVFSNLMNNIVSEKTMDNVRKHRDSKLVTEERKRNDAVPEPNCHPTKLFTEHLLVVGMTKTKILMNKPVYLVLLILDLSKTQIYEFWYDYINPKYGEKVILCYMDTVRYIIYVKTEDTYKDSLGDVETRFVTSAFEIGRRLPKEKI